MADKGWVKLWRDQFNNWISKKPFCDGYAWCYLYQRANHKKGVVNFRNEYIQVERGQLLTSKLQLQEIFGWSYRHVENFLKALENDEMIKCKTTKRYTIITIVNYDKYQGNGEISDEQTSAYFGQVEENRAKMLGTDYEQNAEQNEKQNNYGLYSNNGKIENKFKKNAEQNKEQNNEKVMNRCGTDEEQMRNRTTQTRMIKNVKNVKNIVAKKEFATTSIEYQLAKHLYEKILQNNPEHKKPNLQEWAVHIDRMIRLDERKPEKIKEVIDWCQADDFWYANILSTKKLREKYDQLVLQMKNKPKKRFSYERNDDELAEAESRYYT